MLETRIGIREALSKVMALLEARGQGSYAKYENITEMRSTMDGLKKKLGKSMINLSVAQ